MSRERELLRRLDKAEADLRAVGGYENELQYIPAGGVRSLLADLRALLAEPEGGTPESNMLWEARNWAGRKPTPRSRAEAAAMVERFASALGLHVDHWLGPTETQRTEIADARAALLAALTGGSDGT